MRKLFAIAALFILSTAAVYFSSCKGKKSETTTKTSNEDSIKSVLARGEYLVMNVVPCLDCHSKRDFAKYSGPIVRGSEGMGGEVFDSNLLGEFPGVVYASNITPDSVTGIGTWTEERFMTRFTQCREEAGYNYDPGKQNTYMPMTFYAGMTNGDLKSIFAYLKSLKPVSHLVE